MFVGPNDFELQFTKLTFLHGHSAAANRMTILLQDLVNRVVIVKLDEAKARARVSNSIRKISLIG